MEDIEIARNTKLEDINVIARKLNVEDDIEQYGKHKAKISLEVMKKLKSKKNVITYKDTNSEIVREFKNKYDMYSDRFFYDQFINCGGFIVDNWIRIYGCGTLNVIEKNKLYNKDDYMDILIGEDVLGGVFALKNKDVYYYAPDTNKWENLELYYTEFIYWILNYEDDVNDFYKGLRWANWKEDCKKLGIADGFSLYPLLPFECDIEKRSRKIIPIDELIRLNFDLGSMLNE